MNERAIASIEIDHLGRLLVRPALDASAPFEHVYREANGLRWERHAFSAYEPQRRKHEELAQHIVVTVRSAFDEQLCITAQTAWIGVAPKLERQLRHVLPQKSGSL